MVEVVYMKDGSVGFRYPEPKPPAPRQQKEVTRSYDKVVVARRGRWERDEDVFSVYGGEYDYDDPDQVYLTRAEAEEVILMLREVLDAPEEWE